ncbi:MAG: ROK family protein [Candidatus Fimenecus sp.]
MIFALDIGGTFTKYAHIENGEIIQKGKWKTTDDFSELLMHINRVICKPADRIGISCVGFWNANGDPVGGSSLNSIVENPFVKTLADKYNCPVYIENDARCALLAEAKYGVLKDTQNAVLFVLGSSLGCAVQIDGKLFTGTTRQAGAMFMMPETFDGDTYVFDKAANSIQLTKAYDPTATSGNMLLLEEKAVSGDEKAAALLEQYAKAAALKCWYAYLAYDPECIALGGGIANSSYIFEKIQFHLQALFTRDTSGRTPLLRRTQFGADSNLLGAALLTKS